jgi:flagellar biosynthesis/type III secretory pathway protein FliH
VIRQARVLRAGTFASTEAEAPAAPKGRPRRVVREELEGRTMAQGIVQDAREEAAVLLARARQDAEKAAEAVLGEIRERADADLAARWAALRQKEHARMDGDVDRTIALATALAERLLGAALGLAPDLVTGMARGVLDEARGARRAVIDAHPLDAAVLCESLTAGGLNLQSFEVQSDAALARGEFRLHTDIGTIDARLAPRFEQLSAALRDALT